MADTNFFTILDKASQLPMVEVERDAFLRRQFKNSKHDEKKAIEKGTIAAGVSRKELRKIANGVIKFESTQVTLISTIAGIPGGLAMLGTVPADMVQYMAYLIRVAQKLMYLYGIDDINDISDGSQSALILALGAMLGAESSSNGIRVLCKAYAKSVEKKAVQKMLTKGSLYAIVKKIASSLELKLQRRALQ